jgi:hypothetical protein
MTRKAILSVLAIFGCLAIAACGGSSTTPSATVKAQGAPPLTKASFDAQVGSLCQRANSAFAAAKEKSGQVAVISHYLTVFHSVKVPSQLKATYTQYLGVLAQELAALRRGDTKQVFQLAHSKAKPLARKLGAKGCITAS